MIEAANSSVYRFRYLLAAVLIICYFAYVVAAASPYIMGWLIAEDPGTKVSSYFWAWIWVACTALIGVIAASLRVDRRRKGAAAAPAVA
jgi:hypothetical protein